MAQILEAPAPWNLQGRSWSFPLSGLSDTQSFPAGFSAPNEAEVLASAGKYIGGPGLVMVVSYSDSPVGPYDELIYVPGRWKYADGTIGCRITRIYVSTRESTMNGRRNWNIPKHVADFDIRTGDDGITHLSVHHPGSSTPFFKASVKPIPLISSLSIRFSSSILGKFLSVTQPPLPAGELPEEVATTDWAVILPKLTGNVRLLTISSGLDGKVGDGIGFPAVRPWAVGCIMESASVEFPCPTAFKL